MIKIIRFKGSSLAAMIAFLGVLSCQAKVKIEVMGLLSQLKGEDRVFMQPNALSRAALMQSFFVQLEKDFDLYGVFDGHIGQDAVGFFSKNLSGQIIKNLKPFFTFGSEHKFTDKEAVKKIIKDTFSSIEKEFENNVVLDHYSGTTASMAIISPDDDVLYVANVGDSRVVISRDGKAVQLTQDHVPDNPEERVRFENRGIKIDETKIKCKPKDTWIESKGKYPLTRSLGATDKKNRWKDLLLADPYIVQEKITLKDRFLILASDGLWDWVESQAVVDVVSENIQNLNGALSKLKEKVKQASLKGADKEQCDDLAIIIVKFIHEAEGKKRKSDDELIIERVD